jgi:hypothetical protein
VNVLRGSEAHRFGIGILARGAFEDDAGVLGGRDVPGHPAGSPSISATVNATARSASERMLAYLPHTYRLPSLDSELAFSRGCCGGRGYGDRCCARRSFRRDCG